MSRPLPGKSRRQPPAAVPLGDAALLLRLGGGVHDYARAHALANAVASSPPPGLLDAAAAYDTVALYFDPLATSMQALASEALRQLDALAETAPATGELITIPVIYDGPDLPSVAERTGLTTEQVIELHSGPEYTALAVGFVPGFAYLGDLDERLHLPRRDSPRARVPAGSVAIAGAQTSVYPFATPGGWHLLGRTDVRLFDALRSPPAVLSVGARVRFEPA